MAVKAYKSQTNWEEFFAEFYSNGCSNPFAAAAADFDRHAQERQEVDVRITGQAKSRVRLLGRGVCRSKVEALEKAIDELAADPKEGYRERKVTDLAYNDLRLFINEEFAHLNIPDKLTAAIKEACYAGDTAELVELTGDRSLADIRKWREEVDL